MAIRRAAYKPPTLKQYREAAARYFELLASGMEREKALHNAGTKSSSKQTLDLARFVAWRLLHLDEEWQYPPYGWMEQEQLARLSTKMARWHWLRIAEKQYFADHEAESAELAVRLGINPDYFAVEQHYRETGEIKKIEAEIEALYPDEAVCKELLIQHHNAIAGIEAPKQLPAPMLMIDLPARSDEAMVA